MVSFFYIIIQRRALVNILKRKNHIIAIIQYIYNYYIKEKAVRQRI